MRKKTLTAFILFAGLTINAQEAIVASGGNAKGMNGSSSYSIGQAFYTTNSDGKITSSQGIQNAYEILEVANEKNVASNLKFTAYPNPTTDMVELRIENFDQGTLFYQLYNVSGQLLASEKLAENNTSISMKNFPSGTFFLKVIGNGEPIKTFKIIKN